MTSERYLKLLCEAKGPTGFERPVAQIAAEAIAPFADEVRVDTLANLVAIRRCGLKDPKKLLIAAHLDEVGLVVTGHEDGFLCVGQIGGVDQRVLPDRDLCVLTDPPRLGVMSVQPPHVLKAEDMGKAIPMEELRVDVGMTQEEVVRAIPVGTPVAFRTRGFRLGETRYGCKTLDDRACFAALVRAAELIKDKDLPWDVYFVGSTGEERGEGGAPAAVFAAEADVCIAIDVCQASTPDANPKIHNGIYNYELGGGPVISVGPNITKHIGKRLLALAKQNGLPFQTAARPGKTGTDAWHMHIVREGVASGLIGLPLRYMHSPTECIDLEDLERCAQLVAAFALGGEQSMQFDMPALQEADSKAEKEPEDPGDFLSILEKLCSLSGVSGSEEEVREYIERRAVSAGCSVRTDAMGNLIVEKKAGKPCNFKDPAVATEKRCTAGDANRRQADAAPHLMLTAHMDEVGFMVMRILDAGYLRIEAVGGIDPRVTFDRKVFVGEKKVPGIAGLKSIHQTPAADRSKIPAWGSMYIDIGAKNREEAEQLVSVGDVCVFDSDFARFGTGDGFVKAKAIDDRFGCAVMVKLMEEELPMDVTFVFSVQEEIGTRGAFGAAFSVRPDIALVFEGTTSADLAKVEGHKKVTRLGAGPVLGFMDAGTIYDRSLFEALRGLADKNGIPWQIKGRIAGGTDAAAIQRSREGVRVANISAPVRSIHCPNSVARISDMEDGLRLARLFIKAVADGRIR